MSDTSEIVFLCILIFLSVVILMANAVTVLVFWIHRHKLKRTFFLVINITLADLLVGFTAILETGAVVVLPRLSKTNHKGDIGIIGIPLCLFISTCVLSCTYFIGTCLRFDLATSTSCNKHYYLHIHCGYRFVRWDTCILFSKHA